ncbi:hypothetical protein M3Y99_01224800 [Aphelenchoides fujianensis]|nr:hypothetical protein M3Y99_01224800 [Aphelenchoides fujianensis]
MRTPASFGRKPAATAAIFFVLLAAAHAETVEFGSGEQLLPQHSVDHARTFIYNNVFILRPDQFESVRVLPASERAARPAATSGDAKTAAADVCSRLMAEFEDDDAEFERFLRLYVRVKAIFKEHKQQGSMKKEEDVVVTHFAQVAKQNALGDDEQEAAGGSPGQEQPTARPRPHSTVPPLLDEIDDEEVAEAGATPPSTRTHEKPEAAVNASVTTNDSEQPTAESTGNEEYEKLPFKPANLGRRPITIEEWKKRVAQNRLASTTPTASADPTAPKPKEDEPKPTELPQKPIENLGDSTASADPIAPSTPKPKEDEPKDESGHPKFMTDLFKDLKDVFAG